MKDTSYATLTISAAEGGWIVKERSKLDRVFFRWESLVIYIEDKLTSKGEKS